MRRSRTASAIGIGLLFGVAIAAGAYGQHAPAEGTAEAEVLGVVQTFFDTMRSRDAAGARETLVLDGQFVSLRDGAAAPSLRVSPHASYLEGLETGITLQEERMWDPVVKVHGRIAMVWTPYDFHNDGELSHCGIDVFTLLRTEEGWKIAGVTYTVEPEGCEALGQPER